MKSFVFAVPGDLGTPTGGYAYDRRMIAELATFGWRATVLDLGEGFPRPPAVVRRRAMERLAAVPPGPPIVVDGLALGVLPQAAAALRQSHSLIALIHHPLALESGLSADEAEALRTSERAALAAAHGVVVTSNTTARLLASDYAVPPDRITVAPPGSDRVDPVPRHRTGAVALLAVGAIVPRKGYDVLVAALAQISELPWRLTIAGDRRRDPVATARLEADIARFGLEKRIALLGAVPPARLAELYLAADLFVLASRFEGYGMAFAEAISRGLPVIGTSAGALPETVPVGAGILVPPENVEALAAALRRLVEDAGERRRFAVAARAAAAGLPTWRCTAGRFARALEAVA